MTVVDDFSNCNAI